MLAAELLRGVRVRRIGHRDRARESSLLATLANLSMLENNARGSRGSPSGSVPGSRRSS